MPVQKEFYVYHFGNDNNRGTLESPFQSIEKARDEIRKINSSMTGDIFVYLLGGTYQIKNTLHFNERDSGTNGYKVIYKSYQDQGAVVSGGVTITGWQKVAHERIAGLWRAYVPDIENTREMYVNGRPASRARSKAKEFHSWKKLTDTDMEFHGQIETFKSWVHGDLKVYSGYKTKNTDMLQWRNPQDIEFVFDVGWTHSICPVEKIERIPEGVFIKMKMPCFRDCQIKAGVQIGTPSYIENAFELLAEPGDWYFDRKSHCVYYIPKADENLQDAEVIMPSVDVLLEIKGSIDNPVRNLIFEGISFCYTTWLKPSRDGIADTQANLCKDPQEDNNINSYFLKPPASIILDAAENIVIKRCVLDNIGSGGINIQNGAASNIIVGNIIRKICGSGIQVGGFNLKDAHPDDTREVVRNILISNNYITETGMSYFGGVAVLVGYAEGVVVSHNEICRTSYSGISLGWGWGFWDPTVSKNNRIEYNHIHHVMQALHDGAGVYILSSQPGSIIKGNHIHDNGFFEGTGFKDGFLVLKGDEEERNKYLHVVEAKGFPGGIYLDEASSGFELEDNVVYNVIIPFFFHDIKEGSFEKNIIKQNYWNVRPEDNEVSQKITENAGLEEPFRHLRG